MKSEDAISAEGLIKSTEATFALSQLKPKCGISGSNSYVIRTTKTLADPLVVAGTKKLSNQARNKEMVGDDGIEPPTSTV